MTIASTDAHTEVDPLIPQSQGVSDVACFDANFIPIGKAIPINNPIGKSMITATTILRNVE